MAATHNPVIFNAALAAFFAGGLSSSPNLSASGYGNLGVAAAAYASAVDAAIPVDATLSSAANVTQPPATAAEANALVSKTGLITQLTLAAFNGRSNQSDQVQADYAPMAAAIAAQYTAAAAQMITT